MYPFYESTIYGVLASPQGPIGGFVHLFHFCLVPEHASYYVPRMASTKAPSINRKSLLKRAVKLDSDVSGLFEALTQPADNTGIMVWLRHLDPELAMKYDEGDWTDQVEVQDEFKENKKFRLEFEERLDVLREIIQSLENSPDQLSEEDAQSCLDELKFTDDFARSYAQIQSARVEAASLALPTALTTLGNSSMPAYKTPADALYANALFANKIKKISDESRAEEARREADVEAELQKRAEHLKQEIEKLRDNDDGLSLNVIAERAGVSKSTLYDLLSDKTKIKTFALARNASSPIHLVPSRDGIGNDTRMKLRSARRKSFAKERLVSNRTWPNGYR